MLVEGVLVWMTCSMERSWLSSWSLKSLNYKLQQTGNERQWWIGWCSNENFHEHSCLWYKMWTVTMMVLKKTSNKPQSFLVDITTWRSKKAIFSYDSKTHSVLSLPYSIWNPYFEIRLPFTSKLDNNNWENLEATSLLTSLYIYNYIFKWVRQKRRNMRLWRCHLSK